MKVALKIDVDTDRGTRLGVPALQSLLQELDIPACFLFSLGPDNTGRAISRVFRPGFLKKVSRTSVVSVYGVRTLLNGTLLPAPHIGRRHEDLLRAVQQAGFEVGIHCYDHYRWQDHMMSMSVEEVRTEFGKAREEFLRIFKEPARAAGAPGWQSSPTSKQIYDEADLLYASDTRGDGPFFPRADGQVFSTLELPSNLPTFDELLGRPEYPLEKIVPHYTALLRKGRANVFTLHAELEGMKYLGLFRELLLAWRSQGAEFVRPDEVAKELLSNRDNISVRDMTMASIDGRSGLVATPAA